MYESLLNGEQTDANTMYETNAIAVPVYESLLNGEQADANDSPVQHHHQAVHRHHPLQVCSVHLHLLQHEVGAVFEEGWRNSLGLTPDRIIIKSGPGVAVCPDQLPRVPTAAACHYLYSVNSNIMY